jgi:hypothetical protein
MLEQRGLRAKQASERLLHVALTLPWRSRRPRASGMADAGDRMQHSRRGAAVAMCWPFWRPTAQYDLPWLLGTLARA